MSMTAAYSFENSYVSFVLQPHDCSASILLDSLLKR